MACRPCVGTLLIVVILMVGCNRDEGTKQMDAKSKKVKLETTMGDIVIELNEKQHRLR